MKNFIIGFAAFPLAAEILPRFVKFIAPLVTYLDEQHFLLIPGTLSLALFILMFDWDWRRNLLNWFYDRRRAHKRRLLDQLKHELGEE